MINISKVVIFSAAFLLIGVFLGATFGGNFSMRSSEDVGLFQLEVTTSESKNLGQLLQERKEHCAAIEKSSIELGIEDTYTCVAESSKVKIYFGVLGEKELEAVRYTDEGLCNYPVIEISGAKNNYRFSFCGLSENVGKDFELLESFIYYLPTSRIDSEAISLFVSELSKD